MATLFWSLNLILLFRAGVSSWGGASQVWGGARGVRGSVMTELIHLVNLSALPWSSWTLRDTLWKEVFPLYR